jgi:hypothetical protein
VTALNTKICLNMVIMMQDQGDGIAVIGKLQRNGKIFMIMIRAIHREI